MNFFFLGVKLIRKASPLLLFASGVVVALVFLSDRRRSYSGIVNAIKDALKNGDKADNAAGKISVQPSDIMKEACQDRTDSCYDTAGVKSFQASAKVKGHRVAVAAKTGMLTMKDKGQNACRH